MLDFNQFQVVSFDCYGTLIDWEGGLAVISNIDNNLFAGTAKHLKVELDGLIAAPVRSYKPSTRNFGIALQTMQIAPEKLLHVAQSLYRDIVPAASMGISTVWVNWRHDQTGFGATMPANAKPDLELPDLKTLV